MRPSFRDMMHFLLSVATLMNANNGWPGRSPVAADAEHTGSRPRGASVWGRTEGVRAERPALRSGWAGYGLTQRRLAPKLCHEPGASRTPGVGR